MPEMEDMIRHLFVANRSPFVYQKNRVVSQGSAAIGGLLSTMEPAFRQLGGLWIGAAEGSNGSTRVISEHNESPQCFVKSVSVSPQEFACYCDGFANGTLWPLCHAFPERCSLSVDDWHAYTNVNRYFADAISEELSPDRDVLWVHDYHLALTPQFVRQKFRQASIASFWHIPFPQPEVLSILPWRKEILRGLLHSDFIGFHLQAYADHFLRSVEVEIAEADVDRTNGIVRYGDTSILVGAVPLGIDSQFWKDAADAPEANVFGRALRNRLGVDHLALAVDRLDYTKGVLERISAIELLFQRNPSLQGRFTLLQIGVPTRTGMSEYRHYQAQVEEAVDRVNAQFSSAGWKPIELIRGMVPQQTLAAYYRAADIACVTPICDGMNLVAKEFVACQLEGRGALVLSSGAGAAQAMADEVLLVERVSPQSISHAIEQALALTPGQRLLRMRRMQHKIEQRNLGWWLDAIAERLTASASLNGGRRHIDRPVIYHTA